MRSKQLSKKLTFKKETVATLGNTQLSEVVGGSLVRTASNQSICCPAQEVTLEVNHFCIVPR